MSDTRAASPVGCPTHVPHSGHLQWLRWGGGVRRGVQQPGEWTGRWIHRRGWFRLGGRLVRSVSTRRHLAAGSDGGGTCSGHLGRFRRRRPWLRSGIPDTADSAPQPAMACVRVRPLQEPVAGAAAAGRM